MDYTKILIKIPKNKVCYYQCKSDYLQYLNIHKYINILSLSYTEILNNNYKIMESIYGKLYDKPYIINNITKNKIALYISYQDLLFLLHNYVFTYNNIDIIFTNITNKHISTRLIRGLIPKDSNTFRNIAIEYLELCKIKQIDTNIFLNTLDAIRKHSEWFIINKTDKINYSNKENLLFVLRNIINDISYIDKNCIDSYFNIQWWIFRGWDESYAKTYISNILKENSTKFYKKYNEHPELYIGKNNTTIEYYIKQGYTLEESLKLLKERLNTVSKESFIKRYGEKIGILKFNERNIKWLNTLMSRADYIDIVYKRTHNGICASQISQELFTNIHNMLIDNNIIIEKIYYLKNNHEWGFGIPGVGGVLYDFVIPELKYAIEFNGERFHPRKEKLTELEFNNWTNPWGLSAEIAYNKDCVKNNAIINKGFTLDIVWESDYINNKNEIIYNLYNKIKMLYDNHTKIK